MNCSLNDLKIEIFLFTWFNSAIFCMNALIITSHSPAWLLYLYIYVYTVRSLRLWSIWIYLSSYSFWIANVYSYFFSVYFLYVYIFNTSFVFSTIIYIFVWQNRNACIYILNLYRIIYINTYKLAFQSRHRQRQR